MRAEEAGVEIVCRTSCLQLKYPACWAARFYPEKHGREAFALFTAKPPRYFNVVLMDILMPEMDGCAAARVIRHCGKPDAKPPTDNGGLVG